jgi:hypothetical protein
MQQNPTAACLHIHCEPGASLMLLVLGQQNFFYQAIASLADNVTTH